MDKYQRDGNCAEQRHYLRNAIVKETELKFCFHKKYGVVDKAKAFWGVVQVKEDTDLQMFKTLVGLAILL